MRHFRVISAAPGTYVVRGGGGQTILVAVPTSPAAESLTRRHAARVTVYPAAPLDLSEEVEGVALLQERPGQLAALEAAAERFSSPLLAREAVGV